MHLYHTSNKLPYKTGGWYQGEWKDNRKHGYGTKTWVNGDKYEGVSMSHCLRLVAAAKEAHGGGWFECL